MKTLYFITILQLCFNLSSSLFTTVPRTQYVYLNHTVSLECSTNMTGSQLSFIYSGSVPPQTVITTSLSNGGTMISVNFTATIDFNETTVRCFGCNFSDPAYIHIQGNSSLLQIYGLYTSIYTPTKVHFKGKCFGIFCVN